MSAAPTRPASRHRRDRVARGGAAATTPWRRAPLLLLRRPVVFLAIVGAAAILAVAAASGPLFLSTIGTASLHAQAAQRCPEVGQPTVNAAATGAQLPAATRQGLRAMRDAGLRTAYYAADGYTDVGATLVHLFSRKGALDHVVKLTPDTGATGVWLPNVFAGKLGARPGSTITTATGARLNVAGIYRDLAPDPFALSDLPSYWCSYTNQIVATVASDGAIAATAPQYRQGPWLITDDATVARASANTISVSWSAPMSTTTNALSTFDRATGRARTAAAAITAVPATVDPGLSELTAAAHTARSGITGSIVPIEIAGVIVAGLLVGGAGMFWATARQREIRLLVSRGVGPIPLAGKAVLETLPAAVIGAALGYVATSYLVRAVGPARTLEPGAPWQALTVVAGTLVLGLLAIASIGALAGRDRTTGRRASWLGVVPWELALLALAIVLAVTNDGATAVSVDHTVVTISALVVLYPLLGATAALLLVGRVIGLLLPRVGRAAPRRRITPYFTMRRLSRSRAIAVGLIVGTALPCCLLMYGSTVTDTVSHEVRSKYQTNLGAPHALQIYGVHGRLFDTEGLGTQAVIYQQNASVGDGTVSYVLGVDTTTFARFAFLTSAQRSAVPKLAHASTSGRIPAIVANAGDAKGLDRLTIGATHLALRDVATMAVFPGMRNSFEPLIVVDQRALAKVDTNVERINQFWTDDAHYAAARRLVDSYGFSVLFELTSKVVVGTTGLLPVTWLFGYLRALAILIGVVAIAGLVFGLAARTRRRRVSYVLSRRMGMTRAAHLNSLLLELALVIGAGWVAGSSLGIGSFGLVFRAFDVYPDLKPPAQFVVPSVPVLVTAAVSAAVVVVAAVATHLLAERTRPAEILRLE